MSWRKPLWRESQILILYGLISIVMTYPLVLKLGHNWLAFADADTFVKIWDIFWLDRLKGGYGSFTSTPDLFYPIGLNLSFHSISWTVAGFSWMVKPFLGLIDAYNVTILLAVWGTAVGGYYLIRTLVEHRAAAFLGGLVYSFAPYHVMHTGGHPDFVHLAPIPLGVLFLCRAVRKEEKRTAVAAALMVGLAGWTSYYIMDFAFLTLGWVFLFLALEKGRWRSRRFWKIILVWFLFTALFLIPRLLPILQNPDSLSSAIEIKYAADEKQTDLLAYAIPARTHPLFIRWIGDFPDRFPMNRKWPAYLGLIPMLLALSALTWKRKRRSIILWLVIGLQFFFLSLGPILRFNGQTYENIPLPAGYLDWFPPIRAVARPDSFVLGLLLPLAVGAAIGLDRWLQTLTNHRKIQKWLPAALVVVVMFEFWIGPYPGISADVNPFYTQIAEEQASYALIELPMGRSESKKYVYYQATHGKPIVEGLSARTPDEAYDYIIHNELLVRWRYFAALDCRDLTGERYQAALQQLIGDQFRYVVIHHSEDGVPTEFRGYMKATPYYSDDEISVYLLEDLLAANPCS